MSDPTLFYVVAEDIGHYTAVRIENTHGYWHVESYFHIAKQWFAPAEPTPEELEAYMLWRMKN